MVVFSLRQRDNCTKKIGVAKVYLKDRSVCMRRSGEHSAKDDMVISQRKIEYKAVLNILYPIRMSRTTLAVDSLYDRHQSCASKIHMSPLVFWK
jgi:hypothetical protein